MSERDFRRGVPVNRRVKTRPPHPSLSPSPSPSPAPATRRRRSSLEVHRPRSSKLSRRLENFKRCNSEPALFRAGGGGGEHFGQRSLASPEAEGVFYRPQTCADIFSASSDNILLPQSPRISLEGMGYSKDAKVVVNVTVEGSPGPIRAMVKLGSSVEETIKLVIDKYGEEGRTPRLDKDATTTFELHHSYFSLQSLNKLDAIGDSGRRSFYLRKNSSGRSSNASLTPYGLSRNAGSHLPGSSSICLQSFICRKINKFMRRMNKLWKLLGCMNGNR
ncbi:uncharacterized protein At4g22758 [Coffea eugenioides]|uniref:Uncharacterized protein At4g22758-like n=1 Tax=Coffea arabica TaxID=13443 RepID=A0ABM4VEX6_COFAR|nr:uncharacterized protein At4g22758 [Coffea eugenioides]